MKKTGTNYIITIFLIIGLILIALGILGIFGIVASYDEAVFYHTDHIQLMFWLRQALMQIFFCGASITAGLCILIILFLHLSRKTARIQKEALDLQKKNEAIEKLNEQNQKLAHHQRLQTIGTLTSSIAHEFNNLLTPIMSYSMMALEKIPADDEDLFDSLIEIYNSSRKAKEIISRLSDLSRKNTDTSFREVSIDQIITKALSVASPAKHDDIEIRLDLNCWDQRIYANEIQLSQMFLNLVLNAFQAIGEKTGIVGITTTFDEKNVRVVISDTGCGIPEEIMSQIFEPFFTTKEAGKGTGLGLAIVKQVVDDHRGTINAKSNIGEGTSFVITLPRFYSTIEE